MCAKHYRYWLDHTPKAERGLPPRFARSFWDYVDRSDRNGCWPWTGPHDRRGYGRWGKKPAARVSLAMATGAIPAGLLALHRCDNPPCVNPRHLYAGTQQSNVDDMYARGRQAKRPLRTHCALGHELSGRNLITPPSGGRRCRICDNVRKAASARRTRLRRIAA
jgi:hypothetical protein